jgi:outer membrane protein
VHWDGYCEEFADFAPGLKNLKDSRLWRRVSAIRLIMKPTAFAILALALSLGTDLAKEPVPPSAERPWAPPKVGNYERELGRRSASEKSDEAHTPVDPRRTYRLSELIDLAQRNNPETRVAWERARQAAAAVGLSESLYFPYLIASAGAGYERAFIPFPTLKLDGNRIANEVITALPAVAANPEAAIRNLAKKSPDLSVVSIDGGGSLVTDAAASRAALSLKWLLFDFGERRAGVDAAKERLMMASVGFNGTHQKVVFEVTQRFYALSDARQKVIVGKAGLQAAQTVEQSATERHKNGLATKPELLQSQQQTAQSAFELEAAVGAESDAEIALIESLGIPPTTRLKIADIANSPLPSPPVRSVDVMIDLALSQRPDLVAKLANLRAKEAEVRKAHADFYPKVAVDAHVGRLRLDVSIDDSDFFGDDHTVYGAGIAIEVPIFDGFARRQKLRLAEAELRAAESELAGARDAAVREVWKAYTDFKTALRKQDAAAKLLIAAENAYAAVLDSYKLGLSTYVEVANAQRNVTAARSVGSETRSAIFTSSAALALSVGDLAKPKPQSVVIRRRR